MKLSFFYLSTIFSLSALADPNLDIILNLSSYQDKIRSGAELQCFEGEDPAEIEACAVSLCGPAETAAVAHINDANFDLYVQNGVKERFPELEAPVKEIVKKKQESLKKFIEKFRLMQTSGKPIFEFESWTNEYEGFTSLVYGNYATIITDITKPLDERQTYKITPPEGASETFTKGLTAYAESKIKLSLKNVSEGIHNELYSNEESKLIVEELWKSLYKMWDAEIAKNPDFMKDSKEEFNKYKDLDTFINGDQNSLGNAYTYLYYLKSKILGSLNLPIIYLDYRMDCNDNCQSGIKEYLSSLKLSDMLKDLEKKSSEYKIEDALYSCQAALILKSLKDSDKNTFLAHYPETKKTFLNKTFDKYSSHSKSTFEKYLDEGVNLSFVKETPTSVESFLDDLKATATSEDTEEESSNSTLVQELLDLRDWSDKTIMKPDLDPCDEPNGAFAAWDSFSPNGAEDGTDEDPAKHNIAVSLFSCTHGPQGKGVVSHEMGHALSYAFSKNKLSTDSKVEFLRIRKCVNDSHVKASKLDSSFLKHENDTLYSEEDMADVISFNAIDPAGPIFTCALLETNPTGTKFIDLSLVNKYSYDTHSSPLLRVLREAIYKNRNIPASCKQVIEKNKDKFRFQPCL
jgi:hypothetical protein